MTITAVELAVTGASERRRPRWRRWVALAIVVLVVAGGLATYLSLRAHYRGATPLSCACALGWDEPNSVHVRNPRVGPWSASVVPARPGRVQAFEALLINRSSVTQTIVDGQQNDGQTAEPVDVTFARPTGSALRDGDQKQARDFTETTATLAPGGQRWVRYAIHTAGSDLWDKGRSEYFTGLTLKVRVGAWTWWQQINFDNFAFVLVGT